MKMLTLKNVKKRYNEFELDCSMEVHSGMITGFVGRNGAGKTTALKAALGLIHTDGGEIRILGKSAEDLTPADRAQVGVVLADSGFSEYLSIPDLLPVMESMYPRFDRQKFIKRCEHFQLPMKKSIKEYSTGMKRKLQVLSALSHEADFLILDEPTSGMDVLARDEILDMIQEYMQEKEDRAVLISSHIAADLESICDDIYMIEEGRIIFHEDADLLIGEYALLKMTQEQYEGLDKRYILRVRKESFGYSCLTDKKDFYLENYPKITVENNGIDTLITMMIRGEEV